VSSRRVVVVALALCSAAGFSACDEGAAGGPAAYQPGATGGGAGSGLDAAGGGGNLGGGAAQTATGIPCDVQRVLDSKCGNCHGTAPDFGAPYSLAKQQDFQGTGADGSVVSARVSKRINEVDSGNRMPPPLQPELTPEEMSTLNAWLDGGAQFSDEACWVPGGGTGGVVDIGDDLPPPPVDADECFEFLTFGQNDPGQPFSVPTGEHYWNFTFKKPWEGDVQALTIRHKIDNTPVVHHTLLYQAEGTLPVGVTSSLGTHGTDMLLAGWVPGASDTVLPDDVGLDLRTGDFTLELHYFNGTGQPQPDASGMEMCVTYSKRTHAAGVHWLGKEQVGLPSIEWVGLCQPDYSQGPITILSSWPHMHPKGTHFKTIINRGGAQPEVLYDGDFDFDFQATYDTPAVLMPGDTLTTTCTFSQPMAFGTSTTEEMCYNFVIAYPNGALTGGGGLTSSVNHCMQ